MAGREERRVPGPAAGVVAGVAGRMVAAEVEVVEVVVC
jgi:hypothetical protein